MEALIFSFISHPAPNVFPGVFKIKMPYAACALSCLLNEKLKFSAHENGRVGSKRGHMCLAK